MPKKNKVINLQEIFDEKNISVEIELESLKILSEMNSLPIKLLSLEEFTYFQHKIKDLEGQEKSEDYRNLIVELIAKSMGIPAEEIVKTIPFLVMIEFATKIINANSNLDDLKSYLDSPFHGE